MRTKAALARENEMLKDQARGFQRGIRDLEQAIESLARLYGFAASYERMGYVDTRPVGTVVDVDWILDDLKKIRDADDARLARERLGLDTADETK